MTRSPAAVRRRRALGACAAAALAGGVAIGAANGPDGGHRSRPVAASRTPALPPAARRKGAHEAARLSLDRLAGELVVIRFRGTTAPRYVLRALRRGRAAGVILFADNVRSPGQLARLTAALRRAAPRPPVIAVDQEGGPVRRIPWAAPFAGQPAQAAGGTVGATARAGARDLRRAGVTVVLAPVADVAAGPRSAVATRSFGSRTPQVAAAVTAAVRGWLAGHVAPTLKHFPGLGAATANTDFRRVTVARSAPALRADLAAFRAGIAAGAPLVMVGHALYPALDPAHIASQSRRTIAGLLRRDLGFDGVVVTDSLEARAVTSRLPVGTAAVRSVGAGADLALTTGRGSFLPVLRALRAAAHRNAGFGRRVRVAAAHVLALRRTLSPNAP